MREKITICLNLTLQFRFVLLLKGMSKILKSNVFSKISFLFFFIFNFNIFVFCRCFFAIISLLKAYFVSILFVVVLYCVNSRSKVLLMKPKVWKRAFNGVSFWPVAAGARIRKRLGSPGIDSARLGFDSWAL